MKESFVVLRARNGKSEAFSVLPVSFRNDVGLRIHINIGCALQRYGRSPNARDSNREHGALRSFFVPSARTINK